MSKKDSRNESSKPKRTRVKFRRITTQVFRQSDPQLVKVLQGIRRGSTFVSSWLLLFAEDWRRRSRTSAAEFIIPYDLESLKNKFSIGMRFEGEEAPEQRFIGTIVGIEDHDPHKWPKSKWRCLKVQWDETSTISRPDRMRKEVVSLTLIGRLLTFVNVSVHVILLTPLLMAPPLLGGTDAVRSLLFGCVWIDSSTPRRGN
nr:auxin response factor 2-like [Ipomoea batatas]